MYKLLCLNMIMMHSSVCLPTDGLMGDGLMGDGLMGDELGMCRANLVLQQHSEPSPS